LHQLGPTVLNSCPRPPANVCPRRSLAGWLAWRGRLEGATNEGASFLPGRASSPDSGQVCADVPEVNLLNAILAALEAFFALPHGRSLLLVVARCCSLLVATGRLPASGDALEQGFKLGP